MEHFISDHSGILIAASLTFLAVFLPALLHGLKTYQETRSVLSAAIAFISAFLSAQRWVKTPPPTGDLVEKQPPKGQAPFAVLFALAGAATIGGLAFVDETALAIFAAVLFVLLLICYIAGRDRALFLLAACAMAGSGCALRSAEGRKQLGADLLACGQSIALAELDTLVKGARALLEDGRLSDAEAHDALVSIETAAKPGLIACVVTLIHDSIKAPVPPPPPPADMPLAQVALRKQFEDKDSRAKRRARFYLAAPRWDP